jgi:hypothetical protein
MPYEGTYHPPPPGEGVPLSLSNSSRSISLVSSPSRGVSSSSLEADRALLVVGVISNVSSRDLERLRLWGDNMDEREEGPGSPGVIVAEGDLGDRE